MKHVIDNRDQSAPSSLPQFVAIERANRDGLREAAIKHPQARADGNARVVEFCRIERGNLT
jgi:hypothetical protein